MEEWPASQAKFLRDAHRVVMVQGVIDSSDDDAGESSSDGEENVNEDPKRVGRECQWRGQLSHMVVDVQWSFREAHFS